MSVSSTYGLVTGVPRRGIVQRVSGRSILKLATETMNIRAHLPRCIVMALLVLAARAQAQDYALPDPGSLSPRGQEASSDRPNASEQLQLRRDAARAKARRPRPGDQRVGESDRELPACQASRDGNGSSRRTAGPFPTKSSRSRIASDGRRPRNTRRLSAQPEKSGRAQNREWDKDRREVAKTVDDIFRVYDVRDGGSRGHRRTQHHPLFARSTSQRQARNE